MFGWEREITKEEILQKIPEYSIFRHYIKNFKEIDVKFCSELREDNNPSCNVTIWNGRLLYKDFGNGDSLDCFAYVCNKYNLNFHESLTVIANDFGLLTGNPIKVEETEYIGLKPKKNTIIEIKRRPWNTGIDKDYWMQYHLNCKVLNHFEVAPISHLWINGRLSSIETKLSPMYAYKLDRGIYKILSPYNSARYKWISNCKSYYHYQGYNQLSWLGELLVLTSSLKDCMVLHMFKISAIAPSGESVKIEYDFIQKLKKRFSQIIVFYDNDKAGIKGANKIVREFGFKSITTSDDKAKDVSDYVKLHGMIKTKKLLKELL